jgi:hypothetical protein
MNFRLAIHAMGTACVGLAAILTVPGNLFAQFPAYGPPASSYAAEAAKYPGAESKPTPHMADGRPDLTGVWHHFFGELVHSVGGNSFTLTFAAKPGDPPRPSAKPDPLPEYKAQFVAKVKMLDKNQVKEDGALHCMPPGVPRMGPPHQIVQTSKQAVFLYADSTGNHWRAIPLDGRAHNADPDEEASSDGDSIGHWEGDTLVVDVTHLSSDTWLADNGFFHTAKLHVIERFRRVGDTIQYTMTADDPDVLAKPWTIYRTLTLQMDALEESAPCVDNDAGHYVNLEHHDNAR